MSAPLNIVRLLNPADTTQRSFSQLDYVEGHTLADYFPEVIGAHPLVIGHNGAVVPTHERHLTIPAPGDSIIVASMVAGGGDGDGKAIIRIVAMIAITYFSAGMASGIYGAAGGTYVSATAATSLAMIQAGVVVAGAMLVNAMLPPPKPSGNGSDSSATYGIDGAKNTSAQNLPVPVVYGRHRYGGNIVNNYIVNDGDTQYLHMLINCGEGPIAGITDIQLNDVALSEYKDVQTEIRLGTPDQMPIPWFETSVVPVSIGLSLTEDWINYTTSGEVDKLRFDFVAPAGLVEMGTKKNKAVSVPIEIQIAPVGTEAWAPIDSHLPDGPYEHIEWASFPHPVRPDKSITYVPTGEEVREGDVFFKFVEELQEDGSYVTTRTQVGSVNHSYTPRSTLSITENKTTAVRRSIESIDLPEAVYRVRVRRSTPKSTNTKVLDDIALSDINEITTEKVAYRNTAMLALRIRLTDQLSGMPTVTHMNGGKLVQVWNAKTRAFEWAASSNPAWHALDALTNKRYGGGTPMSMFDLDKWREWATYCATNDLEFNGVFDTTSNVWDATQEIFRAGHAQRMDVGTRHSLVIERAETPRMMFTVGNIIAGTFKENWLPLAERANEIEITYNDRENNYKPKTVRIVDREVYVPGQVERSSQINLKGVTSYEQAWRDGKILLNMNRLVRQSIEFAASLDAIGCIPGDVVMVQHDMPQWGYGGRAEAASTRTVVNLDRPVTMHPGRSYRFLSHVSAVKRYSGVISSVIDNTVLLNGFDGGSNVSRLVVGGRDLQITTLINGSGVYGVTVPDASGLAAGQAFELWETDTAESRPVINPAVSEPIEATQLTLAQPLTSAPEQFSQWMFGESTKVAKPFRIKSITGSGEYRRDIVALEYNENAYNPNFDGSAPNYSDLDSGPRHVQDLAVAEEPMINGVATLSRVTLSWRSDQKTYKNADVYLSRNGAAEIMLGTDKGSWSIEATPGDELVFQVVARCVGPSGDRMAVKSGAPTIAYEVLGVINPPEPVTGFNVVRAGSGWQATWNAPADDHITSTEIRTGDTWETGEVLFNSKANASALLPWLKAGTHFIRARHAIGRVNSESDIPVGVLVQPPGLPTISQLLTAHRTFQFYFADATTTQPLRGTELRMRKSSDTHLTWETAQLIGFAPGNSTSHVLVLERGGEFVVMMRSVDVGGNYGGQVEATIESYTSIDELLDEMEGKITKSQLTQDFLAELQVPPLLIHPDLPGVRDLITEHVKGTLIVDVTSRVDKELMATREELAAAILQSTLTAQANLAKTVQQVDEANQAMVAEQTVMTSRIGQSEAALATQAKVFSDANKALSQLITQLKARVAADRKADYEHVSLVMANDREAVASTMRTLTADFGAAHARHEERITVVAEETRAVVEETSRIEVKFDQANALQEQRITAVADDVSAAVQEANRIEAKFDQSTASHDQRITAAATATTAVSGELNEFKVEVGQFQAGVTQQIAAAIDEAEGALVELVEELDAKVENVRANAVTESTVIAKIDTAVAAAVQELNAEIGNLDALKGDVSTIKANYVNQQQVKTTVDQSIATVRTAISSEITNAQQGAINYTNNEVSSIKANYTTQQQVNTTVNNAVGSLNNTLSGSINGVQADVNQKWNVLVALNNNIYAQAMLRAQVSIGGHTYVSGVAIGVHANSAGQVVTQVNVHANTFGIVQDWNGNLTTPFVVDNGVVYIQKAIIRNADIDTLKIAGNAVTVPTSAYTAAEINPGAGNRPQDWGTWRDLQAAVIYYEGYPLLIRFGAMLIFDPAVSSNGEYTTYTSFQARLLRNGAQIWGGTISSGALTFEIKDDGAWWGNNTYQLQIYGVYSSSNGSSGSSGTAYWRASHRFINSLTSKR